MATRNICPANPQLKQVLGIFYVPVIIALNMIDEVKKSGDTIDAAALEKKIGVPVVAISALSND